jgi:hypothetical protein
MSQMSREGARREHGTEREQTSSEAVLQAELKQHQHHIIYNAQVTSEAKIEIISIKIIKVVVEIAAHVIPGDSAITR